MVDRPIMFSPPMVRALLAGTKTQTRRLLTPRYVRLYLPEGPKGATDPDLLARSVEGIADFRHVDAGVCVWTSPAFEYQHGERTNWQGTVTPAPGDRLWVRETWKPHVPPSNVFRLADDRYAPSNTPWVPSIFMPRWASRLTLTVEAVTIERLQSISEVDAIAEGATEVPYGVPPGYPERSAWHHGQQMTPPEDAFETATDSYRHLWNSLHDKPGTRWSDNPAVFGITFSIKHGNIDA